MASSGGMGGGLAGDRSAENYSPVWSQQGQGAKNESNISQHTGPPSRQPKVNLTKEEMQALQECSRESFYYRCVPLGALFVGTTQILVNKQILRGHPRLGAIPKNLFAGLLAYIAGKVSYQSECRRKIMALPNSPLGEAMKQGKRGRELMQDMSVGTLGSSYTHEESPAIEEPTAPKLHDNYQDSSAHSGLDDNKRPTVDSVAEPARQEKVQSSVSYDELRRQNRAAHESKPVSGDPTPNFSKGPSRPQYSDPATTPRVRTNKYGDVIEE